MNLEFMFFFNSILLGVGLAMDAFSVSLADGLNEPCMRPGKMGLVAGAFGVFQGMMPLLGWVCIHTVLQYFEAFQAWIPWIALALLAYIGGKMLLEGLACKADEGCCSCKSLSIGAVLVQGVATSIDALSVGFTIAEYNFAEALLSSVIIALVTFVICYAGIFIGKKMGTKMAGKAGIFGGIVLILIGIEIFVTSFF